MDNIDYLGNEENIDTIPELTVEGKEIRVLAEELKQKKLRVKLSAQIFKGGLKVAGKNKVGVTRKIKKPSKKKEKFSKNSRRISRGKS